MLSALQVVAALMMVFHELRPIRHPALTALVEVHVLVVLLMIQFVFSEPPSDRVC